MPDVETLNALVSITANISTFTVLIWWIIVERKRSDTLLQVLMTDWQRQREEEIERRAEEKFTKKMTTIGSP
jgi:hypothetical protein